MDDVPSMSGAASILEQMSGPAGVSPSVSCAGIKRETIVNHLEKNGIQTRMLFTGNLIKHPCFDFIRKDGKAYRISGDLKNTDYITNNTFWIGVYPGMTKEMLKFAADKIKEAVI